MRPIATLLTALLLAPLAALNAAEVAKLRCEYRENPLGIDEVQPRLSWVMAKSIREAIAAIEASTDHPELIRIK